VHYNFRRLRPTVPTDAKSSTASNTFPLPVFRTFQGVHVVAFPKTFYGYLVITEDFQDFSTKCYSSSHILADPTDRNAAKSSDSKVSVPRSTMLLAVSTPQSGVSHVFCMMYQTTGQNNNKQNRDVEEDKEFSGHGQFITNYARAWHRSLYATAASHAFFSSQRWTNM